MTYAVTKEKHSFLWFVCGLNPTTDLKPYSVFISIRLSNASFEKIAASRWVLSSLRIWSALAKKLLRNFSQNQKALRVVVLI
jgi:hypothetical protein